MCIFSQTQYAGCGHNVETLTEPCELGNLYRTSMHDKIIMGIHESIQRCRACGGPEELIDLTNDESTPIDLTNDKTAPIDLTQSNDMPIRTQHHSKKRARKDSAIFNDLNRPHPQADAPIDAYPDMPMDTGV